jgi:cation diffusion facilitator family transporter
MLEARDLACLRGERIVFAGLSFALAPGGALLLTGANGAGKSSLLRLLAGLLRPAEGALLWGGADALADRAAELEARDDVRAVLLGAAGVWLGFPRADPLVGLLITLAILLVLKEAAVQLWRRLMDAVDPELVTRAETAASQAEGVEEVSAVRARWIGHTIHAEALIVVDEDVSLGEAHAVAERARHQMLHAVPKLTSVTVHVDPCEHDGRDAHADLAHHDRTSVQSAPEQRS